MSPPIACVLLHAMGKVVRSWAPLRGMVVALAEPMLSRSLVDNGSPLPNAMPHTGWASPETLVPPATDVGWIALDTRVSDEVVRSVLAFSAIFGVNLAAAVNVLASLV